jgi:hypothetical protein
MKRKSIILIFFVLLIPSLWSSSWSGGYKVSVSGFHTNAITQSEHLGVHFIYSPIINDKSAITLYGGYSFSSLFFPITHSFLGGISYAHLITQKHPLESLFIRDSSLFAAIDLSVMRVLSSSPLTFINVSLSPFSYFFGDKCITVGSILLNYNLNSQELDWGVKLIEVSVYLW